MGQVFEAKNIATKQDIELETEKIRGEIATSKTEVVKWVAGMLLVQTGTIAGVVMALFEISLP